MKKVLIIFSLASLFNVAWSQVSESPISKKQPDSELTVLGVIIGKTTLKEVKEKFKVKEIYHEGEAGDSLYAVCLKTSNNSTIAFESGEMGGADHTVLSIAVNATQSPYRLNKICEKTSLIKGKIILNKVGLGMSPDIVKRLVGKPSKQTENVISYRYETKEKQDKGEATIVSDFIVEFKDSMSIMFTASRQETF